MLGYAWSYSTAKDATGGTIGVVEVTYGEDRYDVGGFYAELDVKIYGEKGIVTATLDADADLDAIDGDESHNRAYIGEEMGANVTADLDFDLGVSASYVGLMDKDYDDYYQTIVAVVYGGIDVIDGAVEFVYFDTDLAGYGDFALSAVANINAVEGLPITVYFAICDFDEVADSLVIGATVEYEVNGVGLGVALEYTGEKGNGTYKYYDSANYATCFEVPGFSIALHSTLHHMHQKGLLGP